MAEQFRFSVAAEEKGERLDRYLSDRLQVTRSAVERLLEEGAVMLSPGQAAKNYRLRGGEEITVEIADPTPAEAQPENIPLDIV